MGCLSVTIKVWEEVSRNSINLPIENLIGSFTETELHLYFVDKSRLARVVSTVCTSCVLRNWQGFYTRLPAGLLLPTLYSGSV